MVVRERERERERERGRERERERESKWEGGCECWLNGPSFSERTDKNAACTHYTRSMCVCVCVCTSACMCVCVRVCGPMVDLEQYRVHISVWPQASTLHRAKNVTTNDMQTDTHVRRHVTSRVHIHRSDTDVSKRTSMCVCMYKYVLVSMS